MERTDKIPPNGSGNFDIVSYFVILHIGSHSIQIHRLVIPRKVTHGVEPGIC